MITLPWLPNGDPYSPPSPSIYHNYYGDYYQIYDLYMTNTQDVGKVLSRAMSFPGKEILTMDHVFCQRYVPYSIPGYFGQCYLENFYNLIRDWAVLDPYLLELYLFGGESSYGYFTEDGTWVWVRFPDQIPPERKRWPGILKEGEKLFECNIEYPIPLPKGTRIHYLALYGDSIHWLFDVVNNHEGWKPKYYPIINGVIAISPNGTRIPIPCLAFGNFDVPGTDILGDEVKRSLRRSRGRYLEISIPKRVGERYKIVPETCGGSPFFTAFYPLVNQFFCGQLGNFDQNLEEYEEQARALGITVREYIFAYVLNIPFVELLSTRSSDVYYSYIQSLYYTTLYRDTLPPLFTFQFASPWGKPFMPRIYINTRSTTNPHFRYSAYARAPSDRKHYHTYLPDESFVQEVLAGIYRPHAGENLNQIDPYTLMVQGYIVRPPHPPFRILGFAIPGEWRLAERADIESLSIQTEKRGYSVNSEESKVLADFDDEFYQKIYYHCIVIANNNIWQKQTNASGHIGRLPGFYKKEQTPFEYESIILAPDNGEKVLDPEYFSFFRRDGAGWCFDYSRKVKVPVDRFIPRSYVNAGICSAYGRRPCSTTNQTKGETQLDEIYRGCVFDYTEIEEYGFESKPDESYYLFRFPNPKRVIDAYFLDYVLENELDPGRGIEIFVLRNYTMPDSPRVVEMHLAIKEVADCLSAKELAYHVDPESGEIPDDPTKRRRLAANLAWHLMMLCKWNGIQVLDDKNIAHVRGIDRFPIQVVDAEGKGTREVQGHYPFGALAFSNEDANGKVSQIPGYPPSDTSRPQMAYKLKSSEFKESRIGDLRIAPGGYVIVNTIQQLLQVMMQDLDKALGMEDLSAAVVPGAAKDEICTYEGLGAAIAELIHMSSNISSHTSQNLVSNIITQGIVRELLKATGFPLVGKSVSVNVGGQEHVSIPYPGIPDSSPTHYLMFVSLMQTLQPIVASVLEKVSENITKGDIAFKDND